MLNPAEKPVVTQHFVVDGVDVEVSISMVDVAAALLNKLEKEYDFKKINKYGNIVFDLRTKENT